MKLLEIARFVKGSYTGKKDRTIVNILPPDEAGPHDLTFLFDKSAQTRAGAVIAERSIRGRDTIIVKDPKKALYRLLKHLASGKKKGMIAAQAIIAPDVVIPKNCTIEPLAIINAGAKIGAGSYIGAHSYIDDAVTIGKNCEIHPHTTMYRNTRIGDFVSIGAGSVIGKQGFGYIKGKRFTRLKHIGGVIIEDFVEIGGNVTIDRGTIGNTYIAEGTKIDNLVHIAHNVRIGKNCIIMGQAGIAGSTRIADNVILCGQVGISDHLEIGDNVIVYAKSGVFKAIPKNKKYSGTPAREHRQVLRALARLYKGL